MFNPLSNKEMHVENVIKIKALKVLQDNPEIRPFCFIF